MKKNILNTKIMLHVLVLFHFWIMINLNKVKTYKNFLIMIINPKINNIFKILIF